MAEPYQSLYRRFRPQRFEEVRGQDHVVRALRNAVREGKVSHAYLFSGPRGTGKTSTARILAKALDCANPRDGEPDDACESCAAIREGRSLDVVELDAASNRRLDEMRELLSRVALGTPGRWKVYILDEVHQLTPDASAALLKTLEEPPAHVVFVLCTTDPQKVLPTIRSRTQHFEFRLLGPEVLGGLVRDVSSAAGLEVAPEAMDLVVRRGSGSARDALSALDAAAAAGDAVDEVAAVDELVEALCDRDLGRALVAVAEATAQGRDPRRLATDLLEQLRSAMLASLARHLVPLPDDAVARAEDQARRLGPAGLLRAMEATGEALSDMRDALDPRISLEVALVRVARPDADASPGALLERIERLEKALAGHVTAPARAEAHDRVATDGERGAAPAAPLADAVPLRPAAAPSPPDGARAAAPALPTASPPTDGERAAPPPPAAARPAAPGVPPPPKPAAAARAILRDLLPSSSSGSPGGRRPPAPSPPAGGPPPPPAAPPPRPAAPSDAAAPPPRRPEELVAAWPAVLERLALPLRSRFSAAEPVEVEGGRLVLSLPQEALRRRAEERRMDLEAALADHLGAPVPVTFVVVPAPAAAAAPSSFPYDDDEVVDPGDLVDAPPPLTSTADRLKQAFPGALELEL